MKYNFLKTQKQLLDAAFAEFRRLEITSDSTDDPQWDLFDSKINEIDPSEIKLSIEILLISEDPEKLFMFLSQIFLSGHKEDIYKLRKFLEKDTSENVHLGCEYLERQQCLVTFSRSIDAIIELVEYSLTWPSLETLPRYNCYLEIVSNKMSYNQNKGKVLVKTRLLNIPTKESITQDEILTYWLRLLSNKISGKPYWESKDEIEHFVYQNFEIFPGVDEIQKFNPIITRDELYQVTWVFYRNYGIFGTKPQYKELLKENFRKFERTMIHDSNLTYKNNDNLRNLYKEFPID